MGNEGHMASDEADHAGTRERLVARRAAPGVLLVDGEATLNSFSPHAKHLWDRFEAALRALIALHRCELERGEPVTTMLPDGSHSVTIVPLSAGRGFALLLDPFADRDPVRDIFQRYALTPREREVARLLIAGANTAEIAEALSIARSTAIIHVKSIMAKTGSKTRAAAVGRITAGRV